MIAIRQAPPERDPVEHDVVADDPVAEQLAHAHRVVAGAAAAVEPRLELDRLLEDLHVLDSRPAVPANERHSASL